MSVGVILARWLLYGVSEREERAVAVRVEMGDEALVDGLERGRCSGFWGGRGYGVGGGGSFRGGGGLAIATRKRKSAVREVYIYIHVFLASRIHSHQKHTQPPKSRGATRGYIYIYGNPCPRIQVADEGPTYYLSF